MKKNYIYIIGGIGLALATGFFLYRRFVSPKKAEGIAPQEPISDLDSNVVTTTTTQIGSTIGDTLSGTAQGVFAFLTNYNDYQVVTKSSALNVRDKADAKGKVVGSLPKGSKIKAKASGVSGWFDVSKDGILRFGYVSAQFLKALPKK